MDIERRVRTCQLIEKMEQQQNYCIRLGIENVSRFHGEIIHKNNKRKAGGVYK